MQKDLIFGGITEAEFSEKFSTECVIIQLRLNINNT